MTAGFAGSVYSAGGAGFAAKINFQTASTAEVDGYISDVGDAFGSRANGLWFGWNVDNRASAFERNLTSNKLVDTGNKLQPGGQSRLWQIQVPNGVYDIVLAAADPLETNGVVSGTRYNINVENTRAIADAVPSKNQWSFGSAKHFQVAVADGFLTISNGPNATNNSVAFIQIQQVAPIYWGSAIIDNANTHKCPNDYASEGSPGVLGYFEGHTGKKISLVHWGTGSSSGLSGQTNYMAKMWARGTIPVYSWGPSTDSLTNIIAGNQDTYLSNWFKVAKAYGKPFFLNFAREMNGTWYTWSEGHPINEGAPPGSFTNMWRHVHNIATRVGCTNIAWIWVADRDIVNSKHVGPISRFYPGDDYVDWLGMDIYNAGQIAPYTGEDFETAYGPTYSSVAALSPNKPIMVCETATENLPATPKPAWITEALTLLPSAFPNIRAFVWFNWNDGNIDKDYPIQGGNNLLPYTTAPVDWLSVAAFSNGVASPYYLPNLFTNQANVTRPRMQPVLIPEPPDGLRAEAGLGGIALTWLPVSGAARYSIYRSIGDSHLTLRGTSVSTAYTDAAVTNGTTYTYVVRSQNLAGESLDPTNKPSATPLAQSASGPSAPSNLKAWAASTNRIELVWDDASTNESVFKIEASSASDGTFSVIAVLGAGTTAYTDTLESGSGTRRFYRVRAGNTDGDSLPSNVASATTFANNNTVSACFLAHPILLDGNLAEPVWNLGSSLAVPTRGTPNNMARFGVLWDDNYLYVGIRVLDGDLWNDSANIYDDDSVDIYIDGNHDKAASYSPLYDRFFQKGWGDSALYAGYGASIAGVRHYWANCPGGFELEFAIPWTNFNVVPASDLTIGFDIGNNDDDGGGARDFQCVWAGSTNNWQNTAGLGDLYLSAREASPAASHPPALSATITGTLLELSWPSEQVGWQLQQQSNTGSFGLGLDWLNIPESTLTNRVLWQMAASSNAFFRLIWPGP